MARKPDTNWKTVLKQGAAGLAESTIANSSLEDDSYRPAIVDTIPGLVGTVRGIFNPQADKTDYLGTSAARLRKAQERSNEFFDIGEPSNALEQAARVGLPLLIPFGGLARGVGKGVAATAKAAAPAATAAVSRKAAQVAASAPRATRAAVKVAPIAAEIVAPVNVAGRTAKQTAGLAAGAGALGVGIAEAVDFASPSTEYISLRETILGERDFTFIGEDGDEYFDEEAFAAFEQGQRDIDDLSNAIIGTIGATGLFMGARSYRAAARGATDDAIKASMQSDGAQMVGKTYQTSDLMTAADKAVAGVADASLPIRKAGNEVAPGFGDKIAQRAALASNIATGAKADAFMRTGLVNLPNGQVKRYTPLGPVLEAAGRELDEVQYKQLGDALVSRTILDDYYRTANLTTNKDKFGQPVTYNQHLANVTNARSNPVVGKYIDALDRSYRELLQYKLDSGLITQQTYNDLRLRHPNYAELAQDVVSATKPRDSSVFSANKIVRMMTRTEDAGGGIKAGEFAHPMNTIADSWASTMRSAELNAIRSNFLGTVAARGSKYVKRVGTAYDATRAKGNIHTVYENGTPIDYVIKDPYLNDALNFYPRATVEFLEEARQMGQSLTTGPVGSVLSGNFFTLLKAPMFDILTTTVNKPKNMNLGLINEGLADLSNGKLSIGRFDPTQFVTSYTGAVRALKDMMIGSAADRLSQLIVQRGLQNMPQNSVVKLRDYLAKTYEASIMSEMDRMGVTSRTFFGSQDASKPVEGLENIAPNFVKMQANYMSEQIKNGKLPFAREALENTKNSVVKANASFFMRALNNLAYATHNGARYAAYATNKAKFKHDPLQLAAMVRDLTVDSAKYGSNRTVNEITSTVMYSNLAIQTIHRLGRAFAEDPANATLNLVVPTAMLVVGYLHANATDPDVLAKNRAKTVEQKIASLTLWGGVEFPVEHINRPILGAMLVTADEVFGINRGELDMPAIRELAGWLEQIGSNEVFQRNFKDALATSAEQISPIPVSIEDGIRPAGFANPVLDAMLASMGVSTTDARFGRITEPQENVNILDPNDPESNDPFIGAGAANILTAVGGASAQTLIEISNGFAGALGQGLDAGQAGKNVGAIYADKVAKAGGLFQPKTVEVADHLFGPYELKQATIDTDWKILNDKTTAIEEFAKLAQVDVRGEFTGSRAKTAGRLTMDAEPARLEGPMQVVAQRAADLQRDNRMQFLTNKAKNLTKESRSIEAGFLATRGQKNIKLNELNAERRKVAKLRLEVIREYEDLVRAELGDPYFTWDTFKP